MSIPQAEKLLKQHEAGEKLTSEQRRHVIGYLMAVKPEQSSTADLAALFDMPASSIRRDKRTIREERAALIKEDDIGLIIADIQIVYENTIRDLEKSLKKCQEGSANYLNHLKFRLEAQLRVTQALQDLGYYPKNLGTQTVKKFEFRAEVNTKDGSINVRNGPPVVEAEVVVDQISEEERRQDQEIRDNFDKEFPDAPVKQLPAASDATGQDGTSASNAGQPDPTK